MNLSSLIHVSACVFFCEGLTEDFARRTKGQGKDRVTDMKRGQKTLHKAPACWNQVCQGSRRHSDDRKSLIIKSQSAGSISMSSGPAWRLKNTAIFYPPPFRHKCPTWLPQRPFSLTSLSKFMKTQGDASNHEPKLRDINVHIAILIGCRVQTPTKAWSPFLSLGPSPAFGVERRYKGLLRVENGTRLVTYQLMMMADMEQMKRAFHKGC